MDDRELLTNGFYKLTPLSSENRANLRAFGIWAPVLTWEVKDFLVIQIKETLEEPAMNFVNQKVRELFGPATIVLAIKEDLEFMQVKKMTEPELEDWKAKKCPFVVVEKPEGAIGETRKEIEEVDLRFREIPDKIC